MPHSVHASPGVITPQDMDISQRYWNLNILPSQWTDECPTYLVGISEKNKAILGTKDETYHYQTWNEVQEFIRTNRIDLFQRLPSELRRYQKYIYDLKRKHGSVLAFVQNERLYWENATPSGDVPFTNADDYRILYNDWPYAITPNIRHLVVWTKFLLEEDDETGDLTPNARGMVETFVTRTFCGENAIPREDIVWFKNWRSLKSVHAIEHFHVMLHNAHEEILDRITNGDHPMSTILTDEHPRAALTVGGVSNCEELSSDIARVQGK